GKIIGEHMGGFTPFNFEVTNKLKDGKNFVVVKVNNERFPDAVPTMSTDWWNYGGLTRSVSLIETPKTFIRDYFIHLDNRKKGTISGWVQLEGPHKNSRKVTLKIP